jgi:Lysyl oxidase/Chitobiase/beta-hexosaminidase C-terminal domain/Bacterial pre-peptidase C-terminal domain
MHVPTNRRAPAAPLWRALATVSALLIPQPAIPQTPTPEWLGHGASVGPLSGTYLSRRYYAVQVPAGTAVARFAITGTSGDADLYVQRGVLPTTTTWDYRPFQSHANETVAVTQPAAGTWYLMVQGYRAYSDLTLQVGLTSTSGGTAPAAAAPVFSPPPGRYAGQTSVALASATPDAVVRYTVNGSAPTASAEVYTAPVVLTTTTQLQAAAFATGLATSPVATATYTVHSPLQPLAQNTPVAQLAGAAGSAAHFRFAVPSGASSVTFTLSGGTGDADLYVRHGQLASTSAYDQRPFQSGNHETVTLATPRAGDYFVLLHGYAPYAGATLKASHTGASVAGKPDLALAMDTAHPRITTETFTPTACEIEEGTALAGTHTLLRFNTQTRNLGTADLVLGNPAGSSLFHWGGCHGHYHFRSFAQYRLLDRTGAVVRTGKKVGFCLMDTTRVQPGANPSPRYTCNQQGIQAGWADVYSSNLSGQWIDITGVPAGQYQLEVTLDPQNVIDESDETNNTGRVHVTLP